MHQKTNVITEGLDRVFQRIEFRKGGMALVPDDKDHHPGEAYHIFPLAGKPAQSSCTCQTAKKKHCTHQALLDQCIDGLGRAGINDLYGWFRRSVWDMLAGIFNEALKLTSDKVEARIEKGTEGLDHVSFYHGDVETAKYTGPVERAGILLGRAGIERGGAEKSRRSEILNRLGLLTLSDTERLMMKKGARTRRQVLEESFWFRLCYHLFFDWEFSDADLRAGIDPGTGNFYIENAEDFASVSFRMNVPDSQVSQVLLSLQASLENGNDFTVSDVPLRSVIHMERTPENDLKMELWLKYAPEDGVESVYRRKDMEPFMFGSLVYLSDRSCFARLEKPDLPWEKFKGRYTRLVRQDRIPHHLDSLGDALWGKNGRHLVDESLKNLKIYKTHERVHLNPEVCDQSWFFLSMDYGFGDSRLSISDLIKAQKEGKRFIPVDSGWVDTRAVNTDFLQQITGLKHGARDIENHDVFKLSTADLFRVVAALGTPSEISGCEKETLQRMLDMKPVEPVTSLPGLGSRLRDYQLKGLNWLVFLYEQGLSGILCDDMGLGKTHQVMALMVWMKNREKAVRPFLVVAPVTVLSHWESKLNLYAGGLSVLVHHGTERDTSAFPEHDVILTSYGVLRRDGFETLPGGFSLAVFDEAQYVKNSRTQVYKAARSIKAAMKLCVTGTPVENSLGDLKALMDLSFPGYLGSDEAFENRYVKPVMQHNERAMKDELSRLVTPFTLRRMKASVLSELPEKIEDIRTCRLSEDQIRLYRETIIDKGSGVRQLLETSGKVPYIHVFAMLTLLKQICDHPALALKLPEKAGEYQSGKWDLFCEILDEALESGQKIVVYSQYVDMIRIIADTLKRQNVQAVTLTGATRNRGELIRRFNEDKDCRVFVGSLLAGGSGIDLVSASVVIHYDRWWNAAREEQATDRVHRIGQTRGVQVFKLMTKGTLEEKISAIIDRKKDLMNSVVREDDPNLLKTFSREQILDLLTMPEI